MSVEGYWLKRAVVEGQRKRRAEVVRSESQAAVTNKKQPAETIFAPFWWDLGGAERIGVP
jgi:hypothetical protein